MSSHGLLLRLFQSPGFFSVLRALQYIRNYSDNIGITHYLTRRLSQVPAHELADKWMLICHLLVTRPSTSTALENLVLKKSEESTHIALLTLFFFQASLNDLATTKRDTQSFIICSRILQSVTFIIFSEPPPQSAYDNSVDPPSLLPRRKIKSHLKPALIGLGTFMASCPGLPMLVDVIGNVAIDQGRYIDPKVEASSPVNAKDNDAVISISVPLRDQFKNSGDESDTSDDAASTEREEDVEAYGRALIAARDAKQKQGNITIIAPLSPPLVRRNSTASSPTSPSDKLPESARQRRMTTPRPTSSAPSLPNTATPFGFSFPGQSPLYKSRLLRSHYLHSEIQFLQTLATIADRLLVIPRPARISALRAELTNLNHQLPAEICLPLWCNYPRQQTHLTDVQSHHRVVRIPPSESVVLNSAERAPYMLLVEVLNDNMDFDPISPPNKDLLSKLQKHGPSHIKDSLPGQLAYDQQRLAPVQTEEPTGLSPNWVPQSAQLSPIQIPTEDEEVDLVEQLYGANLSVRSVDVELTDSIALPAAPKNKALDIATWSRRSTSSPSTPRLSTSLPTGSASNHRHFPSVSSEDAVAPQSSGRVSVSSRPALTLEEYSNRMEAAAVMLAQLDANVVREPVTGAFGVQPPSEQSTGVLSWIPGSGWITGTSLNATTPADGVSNPGPVQSGPSRMRLQAAEAAAIKKRIMEEMMALEEERMARMRDAEASAWTSTQDRHKTAQDEGIVRRELNKVDPSAAVVQESFASKKDRIRASSPYGHLANWDCISVIVKTGADLRQEQLAGLLIQEFSRIWKEEHCACWVRYFRILITGSNSGLVETITDAISIHSVKKAEYARRLVEGRFTNVSLKDYFIASYGDPSSAKFARAQKNFAKSLAGYSVISYLLQIKDRHNGNLLVDREGHIIHIDFGFILESSPGGNLGFEGAPFKLPLEYVELLGGIDSQPWMEFKQHFRHGFETARKHVDSIITIVELMQKDSTLPCFAAFGELTAQRLRDRFQPTLTHSLVADHVEKLIATSVGSAWTRLYDSFQYYSQGVL